jgi:predicted GNAT family N-acyltransferase
MDIVNILDIYIINILCTRYDLEYNEFWLNINQIVIMKEFIYKYTENDDELKSAYDVRRQVFMGEQGVSEELVFDSFDNEVVNIVAKDGVKVIGTARVRFPEGNQAKLERMAVLSLFRNLGIGKGMISFLFNNLNGKQIEKVVLHAQYGVTDFYSTCGFTPVGLPFVEVGIKHLKMERRL